MLRKNEKTKILLSNINWKSKKYTWSLEMKAIWSFPIKIELSKSDMQVDLM